MRDVPSSSTNSSSVPALQLHPRGDHLQRLLEDSDPAVASLVLQRFQADAEKHWDQASGAITQH